MSVKEIARVGGGTSFERAALPEQGILSLRIFRQQETGQGDAVIGELTAGLQGLLGMRA
ncbi:MAG: hypothetical protein WCK63_00200 [Betaproteobacteria bacterium]